MAANRRERLHAATREEIKEIARQQMAERGPAALSIRGIATQMGMTAPFIYHYYQNRDALVTALIIDAFTSLADSVEQAAAACSTEDLATRALAVLLAHRGWALAHPTDFSLIFGNPIPDYQAPEQETLPVARQSILVLLQVAQAAWQQQRLHVPPEYRDDPLDLTPEFLAWCREQGYENSHPVVLLALSASVLVQGLLSLELYGHTSFILKDPAAAYRSEMIALLRRWGIAGASQRL